ncbi:MAG TPA: hypothetical protein VES00_09255 [Burkholderiaceae bacterium]|jgi:hypothetical protein|nr:hypothetical protein [Burkholderiaceae bacterium]
MEQALDACAAIPQFDRLRYFYGQMLHARDLLAEQAYFREKMKLHNRCLHGWGVVCGLEVLPAPPDPGCVPVTDSQWGEIQAGIDKAGAALAQAADDATKETLRAQIEALRRQQEALGPPTDCAPADARTKVQLACGLALDCDGNELVLRQPMLVDLWAALSAADRQQILDEGDATLYLGLCYRECPIEPVRPLVPDACGATSDCEYGKLRDSVSVVVTTDAQRWQDDRCEPCCQACAGCCVLLARIDGFAKGQPLAPSQIHMEVRRAISLRPATRITGINWIHGATYSPAQAAALLGTGAASGGLDIRFSRPLQTESILDGVVDVLVLEGGRGRSADIYFKAGSLELAATPSTDRIVFHDETGESLNYGDRVFITVRGAFLLDDCCRPVDGAHVGGRVPLLPGSPDPLRAPTRTSCETPPGGVGPWTSGAGGAANFESWFWIDKP